MNSITKKAAAAATLVAAIGLIAATPSEARWSRGTAAAVGFGAGVAVGATAAGAYYNSPRYYDGPAYGYYSGGPYAYDYGSYAYEPMYAPRYEPQAVVGPNYYGNGGCWKSTDDTRAYGYYGSCATPAKSPKVKLQNTPQ